MKSEMTKTRFKIEQFQHTDTGNTITLIVDTFETKDFKDRYGIFLGTYKVGWRRCVGREIIGYFGENLVVKGNKDDIIYYKFICFDGSWQSVLDAPALRDSSGKGVLWQSLENFYQSEIAE